MLTFGLTIAALMWLRGCRVELAWQSGLFTSANGWLGHFHWQSRGQKAAQGCLACGQSEDVTQDLGCDCTRGRLRRRTIMTMKARRAKGGRKGKKLHTLKIPSKAARLRLFKGSVLAGIRWGHEAMGVAPQTRARCQTPWVAKDRQPGCCFWHE